MSGPVTAAFEFDLICLECGEPIRLARTIGSGEREVALYVDEQGLEHVDFHFHLPR